MAGSVAAVVAAAGGFVGFRLLTKKPGEPIISNPFNGDEPETCALTGIEPEEGVPQRPVLAVKVENAVDARPQAGLAEADIVYEEEAEGGITRFMALYQCTNVQRIGPVRSARLVDPKLLDQFERALFAFAGGAPKVQNAIEEFDGIVDLNYVDAAEAYTEDPNRVAPHQFFTGTRPLYRAAGRDGRGALPEPLFEYDAEVPKGKRSREIHAEFNPAVADIVWRYDRGSNRYLRYHGDEPHTLEDGTQISTANVVVQVVQRLQTDILDPAGNPVFDFEVTGEGKAFVFRDGRVIRGRWERPSDGGVTRFVRKNGDVIPLTPGNTWIELYPADAPRLEF